MNRENIARCKGRLENPELPETARNLALLSENSYTTELLIINRVLEMHHSRVNRVFTN